MRLIAFPARSCRMRIAPRKDCLPSTAGRQAGGSSTACGPPRARTRFRCRAGAPQRPSTTSSGSAAPSSRKPLPWSERSEAIASSAPGAIADQALIRSASGAPTRRRT